jgi:hypothetical protein
LGEVGPAGTIAALRDAHLAHLHDAGYLVAARPLLGPPDRELRGLSTQRGPERAVELNQEDPAVRAVCRQGT